MPQSLHTAFIDLLGNSSLSDREVRRLVGWSALSLADLLQHQCITVRYAEQTLFNLKVVQKLEQRHLDDCVELIDWGMQLEDWEEHTPEELPAALTTIARLAKKILASATPVTVPSSPKPGTHRTSKQSGKRKTVKQRSQYAS